jgi:hypothetical protein
LVWDHFRSHYQPVKRGDNMYLKIALAGLFALTVVACGGDEEAAPAKKDKTADVQSAKKSKAKKAKVKKAKASKAASKK